MDERKALKNLVKWLAIITIVLWILQIFGVITFKRTPGRFEMMHIIGMLALVYLWKGPIK